MILLHEQMRSEATYLKGLIEDVFALPICMVEDSLNRFFDPLPEFEGYLYKPKMDLLEKEFINTAVFILTKRDLYDIGYSRDDEWVLGGSFGKISVVTVARLMGKDSTPRTSLEVAREIYLRRVSLMTIHELGHDLVKAPHHQESSWVNIRNGYEVRLGRHCDDNHCAMYEVVDITTPPQSEGYLKLGSKHLYDAGLDQHLDRLQANWFCSRCKDHIVITDEYRK